MQKRAARFVTRNYTYEKVSMTDIRKKIKRESLVMYSQFDTILILTLVSKFIIALDINGILNCVAFRAKYRIRQL